MERNVHEIIEGRMIHHTKSAEEFLAYVAIYNQDADVPLENIRRLIFWIKKRAEHFNVSDSVDVEGALANLRRQEKEKAEKRDTGEEAVDRFVEAFLYGMYYKFDIAVIERRVEILDGITEVAKLSGLRDKIGSVMVKAARRFDELFVLGPAAA